MQFGCLLLNNQSPSFTLPITINLLLNLAIFFKHAFYQDSSGIPSMYGKKLFFSSIGVMVDLVKYLIFQFPSNFG